MIIQWIYHNGRQIGRIMRGGKIIWECPVDKLKLDAPVIRLETDEMVTPDGYTPAILGVAVLGRTILGKTTVGPKLSAPVIYLQAEADNLKLDAPVIRLETDTAVTPDGYTPAILGRAVLGRTILGVTEFGPKLSAPTIYLKIESDGLPVLDAPVIRLEEVTENAKLSAPFIYLESFDAEEPGDPDDPVVVKLDTPVIRLEVIEDGDEGGGDDPLPAKLDAPVIYLDVVNDEEEDPDPVVTKLDAPVIRLEKVEDAVVDKPAPVIRIEDGDLCWDALEGATAYRWYIKLSMDDHWASFKVQSTRVGLGGFTAENLPGGTTVTTYVEAIYGDTTSKPSNIISYTVIAAPVARVENGYLCWDAVDGATGYRWHIKTSLDERWSTITVQSTRVSLSGFTADNLPVGTTVTTYVEALCGDTVSEPSNTIAFTIQNPKLDAPVIRLEETAEEEPDEPVVVKLDAPTIRLEEITETDSYEVIPMQTLQFELVDGLYQLPVELKQELIVGRFYQINWDGSTYTCQCYGKVGDTGWDVRNFGNGSMVWAECPNSMEPFFLMGDDRATYIIASEAGSHTVSVSLVPRSRSTMVPTHPARFTVNESSGQSSAEIVVPFALTLNSVYRVVWGYREYICQCHDEYMADGGMGFRGTLLGDMSEMLIGPDAIEPFGMMQGETDDGKPALFVFSRSTQPVQRFGVYPDDGTIRKCARPVIRLTNTD